MKRIVTVTITALVALWCSSTAPAGADIGGQVPGPGTCDYPMTGSQGMEFGIYDYACAGPVEVNGSHWQAFYGGAAALGTVGVNAGISIAFLQLGLNASISAPVGVLRGVSYWACPDLSVAAQPNPVGKWGEKIVPTKCKTILPKPAFLSEPPPAPPGPPNPLMPPPPAPAPDQPPAPPISPDAPNTPSTNTPNLPKAM